MTPYLAVRVRVMATLATVICLGVLPTTTTTTTATAAPAPDGGTGTPVSLTVDPTVTGAAINPDLVGFNWRSGGEAVAPLEPAVVRTFAVRLGRVAPAPGVYDFSAADAEVDAVEAAGAIPMLVVIERPTWANQAGSVGYEAVWREVVRHYLVDRVAQGHVAPWFESGNEPEFPPTSHGQTLTDLPSDVAAQARAITAVEEANGVHATWGGPGALFADPPAIEAFLDGAAIGGRDPQFVSWHAYTNQPLLGPDGAEGDPDPLTTLVSEALGGANPIASPRIFGVGTDLMRAQVAAHDFDTPPELWVTEWHLSSGGLDLRHDTHEGAAHTLAGLIEFQRAGTDGTTFFAAVDRHCDDPADLCGDWGTATASGRRKPVWSGFDWWQRLAGTTVRVGGDDPVAGLWAIGSLGADGALRLLVSSFSVSQPTDRTITVDLGGFSSRVARVRLIDPTHTGNEEAPVSVPVMDGSVTFDLRANSAALLDVAPAPILGPGADGDDAFEGSGSSDRLPATGRQLPMAAAISMLAAGLAIRRLLTVLGCHGGRARGWRRSPSWRRSGPSRSPAP